jgi:hypothetical protein
MIRANAEGFAKLIQVHMDMRVSSRDSFEQLMDELEENTGKTYDREELYSFWNDKSRFYLEISQKRGLAAIQVADKITPLLLRRNWYLIDAVGDEFITCDSPVFRYVEPDHHHPVMGDGGFANPLSEVTLPLSRTKMLLIAGQRISDSHFAIPADAVWQQNRARAYQAERFLYAATKDDRVRELAREHKDDRQRYNFGKDDNFAKVKLTR